MKLPRANGYTPPRRNPALPIIPQPAPESRTREGWVGAYVKTLGSALALIVLILGAHAFVDRIERDQEDRLQYRAWIADACTPNTGETVIASNQNGKLHCTIYSHAGHGLVPTVVSAAVMELPL